jgi:type II restriction/modification system DNA methylase subunit YeeA
MDLGQLERYAPQARLDFIHAVTARASKLGISNSEVLEAKKSGDALIIGGNVFPASIDHKRKVLVDRVEKDGFDKVMEEAAYTWFNRFTAMRYMEIHGYIEEHPFLLFEGTEGSSEPEVLKNVADLNDWKELNFSLALDLKTQNKTEELYRLILMAQCNSLGKIIPFLFSYHAAETELLLPDGLLLSDSIIKEMITVLNKENLGEVESLGWLYQFYIAEKKDALIKAKKVYKTDEIPAVTQLFTPNWIVKYLTHNSIGRLWLSAYPSSPLRDKMEYYIEPAEQTDEVNKQLAEIIPDSLNPEEITVLDPACGSGHILVEAYDLLKEIYLERGYQEKEIPKLILKNNLFGLDIDDRAAQLARFVLLMKARKDDKRLLRSKEEIELNVHSIQETNSFNPNDFARLGIEGVEELISTFQDAKIFGSLLEISDSLRVNLRNLSNEIAEVTKSQSFDREFVKQLLPLLNQAKLLGRKYDAVIANPPYMGGKGMCERLKNFVKLKFPNSKSDLFAVSMERFIKYGKKDSNIGLVTPYVWMFLSSYEKVRSNILAQSIITSLTQLEYNAFAPACIPVCCFTLQNSKLPEFIGSYINLSKFRGSENQAPKTLEAINNHRCGWYYETKTGDFKKVSGSPISYWMSENIRNVFSNNSPLKKFCKSVVGLQSGDNERFLRLWWEIDIEKTAIKSKNFGHTQKTDSKWFPFNKGGAFRKWYGNHEFLVNWENDGYEICNFKDKNGKPRSYPRNRTLYFKPSITFSAITSSLNSSRYYPEGFIFDINSRVIFTHNSSDSLVVLALSNTNLMQELIKMLNPTLAFNIGDLENLPFPKKLDGDLINSLMDKVIDLAKRDWNHFETSWGFKSFPLLKTGIKTKELAGSYNNWAYHCMQNFKEMQSFETENNRIFIEAYGLQDELDPVVAEDQITLSRANENEDIKRLVSYIAGCIMGRYCLDQEGLVYAESANKGFNNSKYRTFPADDDGIITLPDLEDLTIRDDLTVRVSEFLKTVWGEETLTENLKFVADTLGSKTSELPKETIRRWISADFFKDHLQRYKNRPIYWLFSSGKKKAFEALVYLHRYNESTLSRMRMKYVVPLQTRISDQLKTIDDDIDSASAQERNRLTKKKKLLSEKEVELRKYDETLRHLAEQQIKLDLDDGVKVNYGKFPGLLAETKKVCGK